MVGSLFMAAPFADCLEIEATRTLARPKHRFSLAPYRWRMEREYAPGMPELRHLRYFVAVAEELNFSRAAKRLHMAQPPLSVAIRKLEQEIGATLFDRSSHEVMLTDAGSALLPGARRALAEAGAAVAAAQRASAGELGSLRVAYNWSARFETLPALGQAFAHHHPDVELLTEEMRPNLMLGALRSGTIDVAIALYPEIGDGLSYELVRREPVVAVLSSSHPRARGEAIGLEALADEFLLFPREFAPRLHDFYVDLCRRAGFEPKQGRESSRTRWTLGTWDESTAALLPQSVSSGLPGGAVAIPLSDPARTLETQLVWRSDDPRASLSAFIELSSGVFAPLALTRAARHRSHAAALRPRTR
jgi:DNA-binding transcriptional LysR family regulator